MISTERRGGLLLQSPRSASPEQSLPRCLMRVNFLRVISHVADASYGYHDHLCEAGAAPAQRMDMKLNDTEFIVLEQQVSIDVLLEKYAKGDERSIDEVRRRVARALAAVEPDAARWEGEFFDALTLPYATKVYG